MNIMNSGIIQIKFEQIETQSGGYQPLNDKLFCKE